MGKLYAAERPEGIYTQRLEKIEAQLNSWLPENPDSSWLEKVFLTPGENISPALLKSLSFPGWDLVNRGGKRWRPLLMVLIAEALAGEKGAVAALSLSPLVEFAHNASLIHDDIEDNSDERRGKPAVHLLYGNDVAINSGSFLYFLSLACISSLDFLPQEKNRIFETYGIYMRRLHLGQAMDISWHNDFFSFPKIEEYERMCRLKTGCLARLAAVLGLFCAESKLDGNLKEPTPTLCGRMTAPNISNMKRSFMPNFAEKLGEGAEKLGLGFRFWTM